MLSPRWKIAYVPWWKPLPLVTRDAGGGWTKVGYVWRQKARLVNNLHAGWIAFVDEQTPEKLLTCPSCDNPIDRTQETAK